MNRSISHPIDENFCKYWILGVPPSSGLGKAWRGTFGFWENKELKPPRGALRGGGTYHKGGMGASAPITYLLRVFHRKSKKMKISLVR